MVSDCQQDHSLENATSILSSSFAKIPNFFPTAELKASSSGSTIAQANPN
jgi:hypothetical protein